MDLVGPREDDETLSEEPLYRYVAGILFPASVSTIDPELDLDDQDDDPDAAEDPGVSTSNVRYPSSLGITFAVDPGRVDEVRVIIEAARYREVSRLEQEGAGDSEPSAGGPSDSLNESSEEGPSERYSFPERRGRAFAKARWGRIPVGPLEESVALGQPRVMRKEVAPGLELYVRVRAVDERGSVPVTAVILNTLEVPQGEYRDAHCFFQASIRVEGSSGASSAFVERPLHLSKADDADLRSYRLLYRHGFVFAVGHGCSASWEPDVKEVGRAAAVMTTCIPEFDVPVAESNPALMGPELGMEFLAAADKTDVIASMRHFLDGYVSWIVATEGEARGLPEAYRQTAAEHLDACRLAESRMRRGVATLNESDDAWAAFRLMNEAMGGHLSRAAWIRDGSPGEAPPTPEEQRWYPFQLGFILLCLEGIVSGTSEDRAIADLLWFPTGGGKTEAYLGLIAFTIFLRRLRRSEQQGAGLTALMRYTLRLLTIQQFERATALICACEAIRKERSEALGASPISVGLWVGRGGTPNTMKEARKSLDSLRKGLVITEANPVQLRQCPWCGVALDHTNYLEMKSPSRLVVRCGSEDCVFKNGLPVHVVDDDVYRERPSLLIATVDKFAGITWRSETDALFGLDDASTDPPELIIQDELHLISGPLGSLAGLYESAVDVLCTKHGIGPKVVASTATIRRADEQARALFARELHQFPPPGIDARDSYFAVEAPSARKGSRLYVGVLTPSTSQSSLMIRTYADLLQRAFDVAGDGATRDPYWTLVGYFNSLRVLGGARIQVLDDVEDRIALLAGEGGKRNVGDPMELTSRESSAEIPARLKQMEISYPDPSAIDVILATNMISVGVDINRLGLMVVMGQPQSTSEYIQATSRVGRKFPGLVIVVFNASRSRDLSHYESFVGYHSAMYRQVEATSVTPFSPRARDRALHAVLVALARLTIPELRPDDGAASIRKVLGQVEALGEVIVQRAAVVDPDEAEGTRAQIRAIIDHWTRMADEYPKLHFRAKKSWRSSDEDDEALLIEAALDSPGADAFPTMWSLRDVDATSALFLVKRG
jgi:hypothetical protein